MGENGFHDDETGADDAKAAFKDGVEYRLAVVEGAVAVEGRRHHGRGGVEE